MNILAPTFMNNIRSTYVMRCRQTSPFQSLSYKRLFGETAGSHGTEMSASTSISSIFTGPWDPNNRIRVLGAILAITGSACLVFDTFYRRATKQELQEVKRELMHEIDRTSHKLDKKFDSLNNKIDGLTLALLHTHQRDKLAIEQENLVHCKI